MKLTKGQRKFYTRWIIDFEKRIDLLMNELRSMIQQENERIYGNLEGYLRESPGYQKEIAQQKVIDQKVKQLVSKPKTVRFRDLLVQQRFKFDSYYSPNKSGIFKKVTTTGWYAKHGASCSDFCDLDTIVIPMTKDEKSECLFKDLQIGDTFSFMDHDTIYVKKGNFHYYYRGGNELIGGFPIKSTDRMVRVIS